MFDIEILTIGNIKEKWIKDAIQEYLKRLKPYSRIKIVELKNEAFGNSQKDKAKNIETQRLKEYLSKQQNSEIFFLDEYGENISSKEFGAILDKISKKIIFVIAGSLGYNREILENSKTISLSKMTFTHEMARLILLEQIYRGICIAKNKDYHY